MDQKEGKGKSDSSTTTAMEEGGVGGGEPSIVGIFRYADAVDKLLMAVGVLGSVGNGAGVPGLLFLLAGIINSVGRRTTDQHDDLTHQIDQLALQIVYWSLAVGTAAFLDGWCWMKTAERQTSRMRRLYLESVLRQDVGSFDTSGGGDGGGVSSSSPSPATATSTPTYQVVSSITTDADIIQNVLCDKISKVIAGVSDFFVSVAVAFRLSWLIGAVGLPLTLVFIVPGLVYGKHMMQAAEQASAAYGVAGGTAEQAISSIRTVVSCVGEQRTTEKFRLALEKCTSLGIKQGLMKGMTIGVMGIVYAVMAFDAWLSSTLVINKKASGGDAYIASVCTIMGGLAIMTSLPNLKNLADAAIASSHLSQMIDKLPQLRSDSEKGGTIQDTRGDIEFKGVGFRYPSRPDSQVLRDFNLVIRSGQTVGLVGRSGSGKSTVVSLLQKFYKPSSGEILLDGQNIQVLQLQWFRSQMGLVSQEPTLFATSIKDNIRFGKMNSSMDEIIKAAKAANAHNFITKLPKGYDTHVGHFGFQMSGGEKQRIAIARALIKEPRILLLDEATSALDSESERLVQGALDQVSIGLTTLVVTHRLSTIQRADLVVVLHSGEAVESGTHEQLTEMNGIYAEMLQLQNLSSEDDNSEQPKRISGTTEAFSEGGYSLEVIQHKRISGTGMFSEGSSSFDAVQSFVSPVMVSPAWNAYHSPTLSTDREHATNGETDRKIDYEVYKPSIWYLITMNKHAWRSGLLGCIGAVLVGAINPFGSYCIGSLLSAYFDLDKEGIVSGTRSFVNYYIAIAFLNLAANVIQHYYFGKMGELLTSSARQRMLEKILSFEMGWFDNEENSSAAICTRLSREASLVKSLVGDRWSLIIQSSTSVLLAFAIGLTVTWRLSYVIIAIQPLVTGSCYLKQVLLTKMAKKSKKAHSASSKLAGEAVVNHRIITSFSLQSIILSLFEDSQEGPRRENIRGCWIVGICLFVCQSIAISSVALSFWYGVNLLQRGLVTPKHMFQSFFILMGIGKLIADAASTTSDLTKSADSVASVIEIIERESSINPDDPRGMKYDIKGSIELRNVMFSYPERPEKTILRDLSLSIEAGKTVALVGHSGCGKSTVIALIERFYDPLAGSIKIDGKNIKSFNLRFLRSQIALVSQEPTIFGGTIHENIAYGKEDATEAEVLEAASLASAHEFISGMVNGYETECGEKGVQLSGGQKQRIAIARAILKNPCILLLDEATSALDATSEHLVHKALDTLMVGRTCIMVAHRLSTIRNANHIAVVQNGKIAEKGTHGDLIARGQGGAYYELIKSQEASS